MILIYMGHNIIAYFSLFLLLIAIVFYLIFNPAKSNIWYILKRSGISAIVFFAVLSIYLIPMLIISDYYDPGKIKLNILSFFVPFRKYIYDANYLWGKTWEGFTVEFSPIMFTFLFVMVFVTIYQDKKYILKNYQFTKSQTKTDHYLLDHRRYIFLFSPA